MGQAKRRPNRVAEAIERERKAPTLRAAASAEFERNMTPEQRRTRNLANMRRAEVALLLRSLVHSHPGLG